MSARVALLVHNRFEDDPRVSRHARAAKAAGYRVAVLSVVAPSVVPRWRSFADGIEIYESRFLGRSPLGLLRSMVERQVKRFGAGARPTTAPGGAAGSGGSTVPQRVPGEYLRRASLRGVLRDLLQIGLLLRNNYGIFRQFRGVGAALVHANDLNVLPAGYLLARYWHAPLIYDSHELWVELDADWSPFLRWLFARMERVLCRRSQAVVTVNGPIADELARRHGIERPLVVMNCAELPDGPGAEPGEAQPDGHLQVIYQGMFHRHTGLLQVIDAAAQVPEVRLSIRGRGELREAIVSHIAAGHRADQVTLLDPIPMREMVPALKGYDVGLVPYIPQGMNYYLCSPNKLFEYMAAGLAVVCSDLPVLREVVTDAECGLLFEPGNSASLAGALRRLASDRPLLRQFQENARRAARTRYNATYEEARLLDLYQRVLAASRDHLAVARHAGLGPAGGLGRSYHAGTATDRQ